MKKWIIIFFICIFCVISFHNQSFAEDAEPKASIFLQVNRSLDLALFPILKLHIAQNYNLREPDCIDFNNLCKEVQDLTVNFCKRTQIQLYLEPTVNIFAFQNKNVRGFVLQLNMKFVDLDENVTGAVFTWELKKHLILHVEITDKIDI